MNQLINLLNRVIGNSGRKLKKANEYMYWSPFISHHKPKLQINIVTGKWHCWVSNQGGHNLFQLLKRIHADKSTYKELNDIMGSTSYSTVDVKGGAETVIQLPEEFKSIGDGDSVYSLHALNFLYSRGLSDVDILRYNIGYCLEGIYQNRIIIPSYDGDGVLNYFVGRDFYKGGMKYKNPPTSKDIVGFDLYINWNEPIVLCEGVFDAIAIKSNAIPLFGKTILPTLYTKIVENRVKYIFISLDEDALTDSLKMISKFHDLGIEVNFVNLQGQDPGELGYSKMIHQISTSKIVDFRELLRMKLYGTK